MGEYVVDTVGETLGELDTEEQGEVVTEVVWVKDMEGLLDELGVAQAEGSKDIPIAPQADAHVQGMGTSVLSTGQ